MAESSGLHFIFPKLVEIRDCRPMTDKPDAHLGSWKMLGGRQPPNVPLQHTSKTSRAKGDISKDRDEKPMDIH